MAGTARERTDAVTTDSRSTTGTGSPPPLPARRLGRRAQGCLLVLSGVLTVGALGQFFLAGLGVFDAPRHWGSHAIIGSTLGLVTYVVWIPAALARVGRGPIAGALLLPLLFIAQHAFPQMDQPFLRALHPLNGAVIFALSLWLTGRAAGALRSAKPAVARQGLTEGVPARP